MQGSARYPSSSHGWTHCPLFSLPPLTLGQLDWATQLPWAWPPLCPSVDDSQAGS